MTNATRIPRKFIGYLILFAMFSWLFLPGGVREKRIFAEENQPLTAGEIKNIENKLPLFFEANKGQTCRFPLLLCRKLRIDFVFSKEKGHVKMCPFHLNKLQTDRFTVER